MIMQREFRGKRADNGEWIAGDLLHDYWIGSNKFLPFSIRYEINGVYSFPIEVIPETIGQFTGIVDKSGVKIFEGDIIQYSEHPKYLLKSFIAAVSYKDYLASFGYLKLGLDENGYEQPLIHFFSEIDEFEEDVLPFIKVINNIHDNPELIQK
jgi:uncharacterized phage protein (TIGR01671 family)